MRACVRVRVCFFYVFLCQCSFAPPRACTFTDLLPRDGYIYIFFFACNQRVVTRPPRPLGSEFSCSTVNFFFFFYTNIFNILFFASCQQIRYPHDRGGQLSVSRYSRIFFNSPRFDSYTQLIPAAVQRTNDVPLQDVVGRGRRLRPARPVRFLLRDYRR